MSRLPDDLRYGLRLLLKTPTATATVLIALSFGIGLAGLTFSLIDGALLTTLPFEGGDRIVRMERGEQAPVGAADYAAWGDRQRSFELIGAVEMNTVTLAIEGRGAEPVSAAAMTTSILPLVSVEPVLGRAFTQDDAAPGAPRVVLVGDALWRDRLGGDPQVLGRIVRVNGRTAQIVGVMPAGFGFPLDQQLWLPLELDALRDTGSEFTSSVESRSIVGRLRRGVSPKAAADELTAITRQLDREKLGTVGPSSTVRVVRYTDLFNGTGGTAMLAGLLLGVSLLVLLVACANVANVLLARAAARRRDVAIRLAIGASRFRVAVPILAEISLLSGAGAVGSLVVALLGMRFVEAIVPTDGMPFWVEFRMNVALLAFIVFVAILAAFLAGILPALQASRGNAHELLKDDAHGSSSFHLGKIMRRLVGVEMALSFVLLVLAGLFIRSALNFGAAEFAFQPEEVYRARVRLPDGAYADAAARARFAGELRTAVGDLPQVAQVALSTAVPGVGSSTVSLAALEGTDLADAVRTRSIVVTPGFFEMFRAPPIVGRDFHEGDRAGTLPVAVVNEAFARRYFPDGALDARLRFLDSDREEWVTIIGVAPNLMAGGVEGEIQEAVYLPLAQHPQATLTLLARPLTAFGSLPAPIREALGALEPDAALFDVLPLDVVIARANSQYTWMSLVFLVSGGVALLLAAIGLYGVMAFWVVQRTREIGVRMALGGRRSDITRLVIIQGMAQISFGLVGGIALAVLAGRLVSTALFGVAPHDPVVYGSILGVLTAAAWLGCWLPARRATRIHPMQALAA